MGESEGFFDISLCTLATQLTGASLVGASSIVPHLSPSSASWLSRIPNCRPLCSAAAMIHPKYPTPSDVRLDRGLGAHLRSEASQGPPRKPRMLTVHLSSSYVARDQPFLIFCFNFNIYLLLSLNFFVTHSPFFSCGFGGGGGPSPANFKMLLPCARGGLCPAITMLSGSGVLLCFAASPVGCWLRLDLKFGSPWKNVAYWPYGVSRIAGPLHPAHSSSLFGQDRIVARAAHLPDLHV